MRRQLLLLSAVLLAGLLFVAGAVRVACAQEPDGSTPPPTSRETIVCFRRGLDAACVQAMLTLLQESCKRNNAGMIVTSLEPEDLLPFHRTYAL